MLPIIDKLKEEFLDIRTVNLISKTKTVVERLFWFLIALSGTIWFFYFMSYQFKIWNRNSIHITKANLNLSDLHYPAVTFCSKSANKYGVAERLGNYLNANANLDNEFYSWLRTISISCALDKIRNGETGYPGPEYTKIDIYKDVCLSSGPEESLSHSCKVLAIDE